MSAIQNRQLNSIFERIFKDKNGVLVRIRFTVVEINNKFVPQIISITPFLEEKVICLPCNKVNQIIIEKDIVFSNKIISPYFSLDFLMSQPTRAPANR